MAGAFVPPEAPKDERVETFGMAWDDLVAWFKSKREKRLEAVTNIAMTTSKLAVCIAGSAPYRRVIGK
jgi:hypothetical protein